MAVAWHNLTIKEDDDVSPEIKWNGTTPRWTKRLRIFGEISIVRIGGKQEKTQDRGVDCMIVGYRDERGEGNYRMLNLRTKRVSVTTDVSWMDMKYGTYVQRQKDIETVDSNRTRDTSFVLFERNSEDKSTARRQLENDMLAATEDADSTKLM